jgi:hypothetical protein
MELRILRSPMSCDCNCDMMRRLAQHAKVDRSRPNIASLQNQNKLLLKCERRAEEGNIIHFSGNYIISTPHDDMIVNVAAFYAFYA